MIKRDNDRELSMLAVAFICTGRVNLSATSERDWNYTALIRMIRQLLEGRMFPLTLEGLDAAMRELAR